MKFMKHIPRRLARRLARCPLTLLAVIVAAASWVVWWESSSWAAGRRA